MVDLAEIQAAYYMVAATGVLVAAVFYILNLRETTRNRRVALTQNLIQTLNSMESIKAQGELMNMEWKNYEDFEKKYGSDNNLDNYSKRFFFFYNLEAIGQLLRDGLADADTLYGVIWNTTLSVWHKFLPTIEENRRRYSGKDAWSGFEYLVDEMMRIKKQRDPNYVLPLEFTKYIPDK